MEAMKEAIWEKLLADIKSGTKDTMAPAQSSINITINMGDIVINEPPKDVTRYSQCGDSFCEDQNLSRPPKKTGGQIYEGVSEREQNELVDI